MIGASEMPAIPEDVRKLAGDAATECMPFETRAWYGVRNQIEQAIMADRLARPIDTGREKALEGWQDISTAPRDGTTIDLWHEDFGRQADCYWGKPQHECGEAGRYCDSDWHREPETWIDATFNSALFLDGEFTHWRPLPAPPALANPENGRD